MINDLCQSNVPSILYDAGLAVREKDFKEWQKSKFCVEPQDGYMCCPLCYAAIEDTDAAWKKHLTKLCPRNTRIKK